MNQKRKRMFEVFAIIMIVLSFSLYGCGLSDIVKPGKTFDELSKDEQARVVLSAIQNGCPVVYNIGQGFFIAKPEYAQFIPVVKSSFSTINKILLELEQKGAAGQVVDVSVILTTLQGKVAEVVALISQFGAIPIGTGQKITIDNYGAIVTIGLSTGIMVWNDVVAAMSGNIPEWNIIIARNAAFQIVLDAK